MKKIVRIVLVCGLAALVGCGGAGGGASSSSSLTCGPDFKTPNFASVNDPSSNLPNKLRHWNTFPLTVYFENDYSYDDNGTTVMASDQTRTAMQRWVAAEGGTPLFTETTNKSAAQIVVNFNTLSASPGPGDTLGQTTINYYDSTNQIVHADVTIMLWPNMTHAEYVNGLRHTICHEFGHALFLQGHSNNAVDVMYYQGSTTQDSQLTTRDENTFLTAYCGQFNSRSVSRAPSDEKPVSVTIRCTHP